MIKIKHVQLTIMMNNFCKFDLYIDKSTKTHLEKIYNKQRNRQIDRWTDFHKEAIQINVLSNFVNCNNKPNTSNPNIPCAQLTGQSSDHRLLSIARLFQRLFTCAVLSKSCGFRKEKTFSRTSSGSWSRFTLELLGWVGEDSYLLRFSFLSATKYFVFANQMFQNIVCQNGFLSTT